MFMPSTALELALQTSKLLLLLILTEMELDVYHLTSYNGTSSLLVSTEVPQIWRRNVGLWRQYWYDLENTQLELGI